MGIVEEMIKRWETPEGKAELEKWANDYKEKQRIKDTEIKKIFSNTDYINWLIQFTEDKNSFSHDQWLYFPEDLDEIDRENAKKLDYLYQGIERYAESNYIYPTPDEFGDFYRIQFHDSAFEIGIMVGQGILYVCRRVPIDSELDYIDFQSIIDNVKKDGVDEITHNLNSLADMIIKIYESGVPLEAIIDTTEKTVSKINEKGNGKKLIKK